MGYKSEQFVKTVDENLHCPICHEVFNDPLSCKNGHAFCRVCIKEWLKINKKCPSDNGLLKERDLVRNLPVSGIVNNLDVHCHPQDTENIEPLAKKVKNEEGLLGEKCSWTGKLQELTKHRETCPFQQVECIYNNCNTMMQRREIEEHERKCRYRIVACEVCLTELIQHELQHHQDSDCPDALIPCPNKCYSNRKITKIRRIFIEYHSRICSKASAPCPFADQGCAEKVLRKDMDKHLQNNMSSHMLFLAKQNTQLKDELSIVKGNLRKLQDEPPSSYIWTIHDYPSQCKRYSKGSRLNSPTFWLCGNSWHLILYPNGTGHAAEGLFSLFLKLSGLQKLTDNISVIFRLSVIGQKPGTQDKSIAVTPHVFGKTSSSHGCSKFMKVADALSPAYCNSTNGSLTVKCTIQLNKPQ